MLGERKPNALQRQSFATQLLAKGFLSAETPRIATIRLRWILILWCGHDYRMAIAAGLVAVNTSAAPELGRTERLALFKAGTRRTALATMITHLLLAGRCRSVKGADAEVLPHADVVAWAVGAAAGAVDMPPPGTLDGDAMQSVVELVSGLLAVFGRQRLGRQLLESWAIIEQKWRDRSKTLVLAPPYSENIGHQAIVAALHQACRDRVFAQTAIHLLPGRPHNPYLVSLVASLAVPAPAPRGFVEPISGGKVYRTRTGDLLSVTDLMSRAADRWRDTGSPLRLDADTRRRGDDALAAVGIPPDTPIVSLHVREPGWHLSHGNASNIRNADIASYAPAAAHLAGRGYRVIRLGDPSMTPLPAHFPALDYARSALKSGWMDVYIAARCRFHIGTASGMSFVPMLFGRPVLFTNYAPLDHLIDARSVVTLFKVPRDLHGGVVPPSMLAARVRHAMSFADLELLGVWLADNDADDILDAVRFMDTHIDATGVLQFPDGIFAASDAALARAGLPKRPQVPPGFWSRYYADGGT